MGLFGKRSVQSFEDDRYQVAALWTFDLLEGLDVIVLGTIHDAQYLCDEPTFISRVIAR